MENLSGMQLGSYRIIEQIGEGGMATVYKAYQANMDRYVAVKVLPRQLASDPQFTARFENEARVLARLQHPHILPVHDFGQDQGYTYFVMPLVETGTLSQRLRGQPLPVATIAAFVSQIGEALDYAHSRGLVHRDVKPSNVLVDERNNCLLTDFGIAKIVEGTAKLTTTGTLIGTPSYMSPEQGRGDVLDGRSDIYSLGIILYEMATGRVPFTAETPVAVIFKHAQDPLPPAEAINPNLPAGLVRVIYKSLAKKPADRYQTAREMVEAIQHVAAEARTGRVLAPTIIEPLPPTTGAHTGAGRATGTGVAQPPTPPPFGAPSRPRAASGALLGLGGLGLLGVLAVVTLLCGAIVLLPRLLGAGDQPAATPTAGLSAADATATRLARLASQATPTATRTAAPPPATSTLPPLPTDAPTLLPVNLGPLELESIAFGPMDGELLHIADGYIEGESAGVSLADFTVTVLAEVSDLPTWDVGFLFRHAGSNNQMRLVIESSGDWSLRNQLGDDTEVITRGTLTNLNTRPGSENRLTLVAVGGHGFLVVNDVLAGQLDLAARQTAGDIWVATELLTDHEYDDAVTRFREFTVYRNMNAETSGALVHDEDDFIEYVSIGAEVRDFVAAARTTNPFDGSWDVGFLVRSQVEDTELRIIISSDREWYLYERFDGSSTLGGRGNVTNLDISAGATNDVLVLAHGAVGLLYVNGELAGELDLSALLAAGDVSLATGIFVGNESPGAQTRYSNFGVWVIP
jgi:tRNA A-37 threonylcarbamoyl transferase component Bud32